MCGAEKVRAAGRAAEPALSLSKGPNYGPCATFAVTRGNEQGGISRTAEEGKLRLPLRYPLHVGDR